MEYVGLKIDTYFYLSILANLALPWSLYPKTKTKQNKSKHYLRVVEKKHDSRQPLLHKILMANTQMHKIRIKNIVKHVVYWTWIIKWIKSNFGFLLFVPKFPEGTQSLIGRIHENCKNAMPFVLYNYYVLLFHICPMYVDAIDLLTIYFPYQPTLNVYQSWKRL